MSRCVWYNVVVQWCAALFICGSVVVDLWFLGTCMYVCLNDCGSVVRSGVCDMVQM